MTRYLWETKWANIFWVLQIDPMGREVLILMFVPTFERVYDIEADYVFSCLLARAIHSILTGNNLRLPEFQWFIKLHKFTSGVYEMNSSYND